MTYSALALLTFGVVFIGVALLSSRYSPLVPIGGLLIALGAAKILLP